MLRKKEGRRAGRGERVGAGRGECQARGEGALSSRGGAQSRSSLHRVDIVASRGEIQTLTRTL